AGYASADAARTTATSASDGPGGSAADAWVRHNSSRLYAGGGSAETSSASYGHGGGSTLTNASGTDPGAVSPAAVVTFAAPDANIVPVVAAGRGGGWGGLGGAAPVPAGLSQLMISVSETWLTTTDAVSTETVQQSSTSHQIVGGSLGNAAVGVGATL